MESKFKIEKNIPVKLRMVRNKYPLSEMEIGNSFFVKAENGETPEKRRMSVMQCLSRFCEKTPGVKFTTSVLDNGVRVWRIQ